MFEIGRLTGQGKHRDKIRFTNIQLNIESKPSGAGATDREIVDYLVVLSKERNKKYKSPQYVQIRS